MRVLLRVQELYRQPRGDSVRRRDALAGGLEAWTIGPAAWQGLRAGLPLRSRATNPPMSPIQRAAQPVRDSGCEDGLVRDVNPSQTAHLGKTDPPCLPSSNSKRGPNTTANRRRPGARPRAPWVRQTLRDQVRRFFLAAQRGEDSRKNICEVMDGARRARGTP